MNATTDSLVAKVLNPKTTGDLRPIICYNVLHKVIAKSICTRLNGILHSIIEQNHCAFVENRSIMHNIMISQDLVRCYIRKSISPRCTIKIVLRKAFDGICWEFLELLSALGFAQLFAD